MKDKRGFEFSFAWIFSLIVGAAILFLAIYFAVNLVGTERYKLDTLTAKQLSIVFEPLETGLAEGKSKSAELREETRIYNSCNDAGNFGSNEISLSIKSGFLKKWQKPGVPTSINNKYIFSSSLEQGKKVYFFSKSFDMPWKISETIMLTTKQYCFSDAPDYVKEEVSALNLENIKFGNCSDEVKVCFSSSSACNIEVTGNCLADCDEYDEYSYGFVRKDDESVFYVSDLLYAAIFSDKEIYECNVKRLNSRLINQALLLNDEANFLIEKCPASQIGFIQLIGIARNLKNSRDLLSLWQTAKEVEIQNKASECSLW